MAEIVIASVETEGLYFIADDTQDRVRQLLEVPASGRQDYRSALPGEARLLLDAYHKSWKKYHFEPAPPGDWYIARIFL